MSLASATLITPPPTSCHSSSVNVQVTSPLKVYGWHTLRIRRFVSSAAWRVNECYESSSACSLYSAAVNKWVVSTEKEQGMRNRVKVGGEVRARQGKYGMLGKEWGKDELDLTCPCLNSTCGHAQFLFFSSSQIGICLVRNMYLVQNRL